MVHVCFYLLNILLPTESSTVSTLCNFPKRQRWRSSFDKEGVFDEERITWSHNFWENNRPRSTMRSLHSFPFGGKHTNNEEKPKKSNISRCYEKAVRLVEIAHKEEEVVL